MSMLKSVDTAKTHEILSRFRPIAPKPRLPHGPLLDGRALQRPCQVGKRGQVGFATVPAKRQKTLSQPLPSTNSYPHAPFHTQLAGLSAQGFSHGYPVVPLPSPCVEKPGRHPGDLSLSLLLGSSSVPPPLIDVEAKQTEVPVERDLLQELQKPKVIVPQPLRPVGSTISVSSINEGSSLATSPRVARSRGEVEAEVEAEARPTVLSDSNNKVRLANSAYKEMVGQLECSWLAYMVDVGQGLGPASKMINGEVKLDFSSLVPMESNGFSCRSTIEWEGNGRKSVIHAPCDVTRLCCDSKDYLFAWKFNTSQAQVTNGQAQMPLLVVPFGFSFERT